MKITALPAIILVILTAAFARAEQPWETNKPIALVTREVVQTHPKPKTAVNVHRHYVGPGPELEEILSWMSISDTPVKPKRRWSLDNGQTWSDFEPLPEMVTHPQGIRVYWGPGPCAYDPLSQATVSIWLRQTCIKGIGYNHCFSRISRDNGHTWSEPQLLRYEDGDDFDPKDPFKKSFLENNRAYFGQNIYRRADGSLLFAGVAAKIPDNAPEPNPHNISAPYRTNDSRNIGGINFVGRWNAAEKEYKWTGSSVSWVPRHVSSRGMMEPAVAELTDGRLLTIYRCSNVKLSGSDQPGRKRFTISSDGGKTLSEVAELKYDDGTQFYSPSAYHNLIRHSHTGKLYWVGNISASPASGNSPRYPLIIAEVDEKNVSLKKDTVTLIDNRNKGDGSRIQLSNFALLENRQTHDLEIYLTRLGENTSDFWGSDAYKYTLKLGATVPQKSPMPAASRN